MIYSDEQDTAKVAKVILCDPSNMALLSHFAVFKPSDVVLAYRQNMGRRRGRSGRVGGLSFRAALPGARGRARHLSPIRRR